MHHTVHTMLVVWGHRTEVVAAATLSPLSWVEGSIVSTKFRDVFTVPGEEHSPFYRPSVMVFADKLSTRRRPLRWGLLTALLLMQKGKLHATLHNVCCSVVPPVGDEWVTFNWSFKFYAGFVSSDLASWTRRNEKWLFSMIPIHSNNYKLLGFPQHVFLAVRAIPSSYFLVFSCLAIQIKLPS